MRTVAGALVSLALLGATVPVRAHDDFEGQGNGKFEASLVSDADGGDFGVGSADGSFVKIDGSIAELHVGAGTYHFTVAR